MSPLVVAGSAIALLAATFGVINTFTMDHHMAGMAGTAGHSGSTLQGMPYAHMPEMFIAAFGILLALSGALLRPPRESHTPAVTPQSARTRILTITAATAALTIDISKTSTLGFVIPGMRAEYGLTPQTASFLAVCGLIGTATGAFLFSRLSGRIGRRRSYLIATLGFTVTSMCGSMPDFTGNLIMCGLMGTAVGGLAPLLIGLLRETVEGRDKGATVAALSVVATAIGFLIASGSALWLEPIFGWRVLWLIGAPTGLLLVLVTPVIPAFSAKTSSAQPRPAGQAIGAQTMTAGVQRSFAFLIGVLTFGLTTWVPTLSRAGGIPTEMANQTLTVASCLMVPLALLVMRGYGRLGPAYIAVTLAAATAFMLLALILTGTAAAVSWICAGALVLALFAVNTMAAVILPIAADLAGPDRRDREAGTVSVFNRLGGLCGPLLLAGLISSTTDVFTAVAVLALLSAAAAWFIGRRHRHVRQQPQPVLDAHSSESRTSCDGLRYVSVTGDTGRDG
ncbi:MFS transporter [Streptomyces filamentosus]|uniref:MFS transporter n=1 Tax=Streptomyces filamentosus TaxID=67294 RepID=UPI0037CCCC53